MGPRFEYYASGHYWYWRLRDGNHKIVADGSEGYATKDGVLRAIQNVQSTVPIAVVAPVNG